MLFGCSLFVDCCSLFVVRRLLCVVRRLVCWLLFVLGGLCLFCLLFVVVV